MSLYERERVTEDLQDLMAAELTVKERLQTIRRIFQTYGFMQPKARMI